MAGLQAPTAAILDKSPGNVKALAAGIAASKTVNPADTAAMAVGLQQQVDQIVQGLAKQGSVTKVEVTDSDGGLIAWIGTKVSGAINYFGGWFQQLYIGGTGPEDAVIVADAAGDVTIDGASITLTKNDVRTVLDNVIDPTFGDVQSLTSQDISAPDGPYTAVAPTAFYAAAWDDSGPGYRNVAELRQGSSAGLLLLSAVGSAVTVAITCDGGTARIQVSDGTNTTTVDAQSLTTGFIVADLGVFANNAAAILAGLPVGCLYRLGNNPDQVCIVHL